jgi:hypothetical protein
MCGKALRLEFAIFDPPQVLNQGIRRELIKENGGRSAG